MARIRSTYVCGECGGEQARWLGRCPACGAFDEQPRRGGSRVGSRGQRRAAQRRGSRERCAARVGRAEHGGAPSATASASSTACSAAGSCRLAGAARRRPRHRQVDAADCRLLGALGAQRAGALRHRRGVGRSSRDARRAARRRPRGHARAGRDRARDRARATIEASRARRRRRRLDPDLCTASAGSRAGLGHAGARVRGRLPRLAKQRGVAGRARRPRHEGRRVAGPERLEHLVDAVLYFEGERGTDFASCARVKNRFGSTDEIGVFEMASAGSPRSPTRRAPSSPRRLDAPGSARRARSGTRPLLVEVQALVAPRDCAHAAARWPASTEPRVAAARRARAARRASGSAPRRLRQRRRRPARSTSRRSISRVALAHRSAARGVALAARSCVFGEIGAHRASCAA